MPGPYTHYLFSKHNLLDHKKEFYVASQGPDAFFYYGIINSYPLINRAKNLKEVRDFGGYLHTINPSITFSFLLDYIKNIKDNYLKEHLLELIKGFMSHYVLDRTCHPYIYYETGAPLTNKDYHFFHMYFETLIDKEVELYYKEKINYKDALTLNEDILKEASKMFYYLSKYLKFDGLDESSYYKSVKSMYKSTKLINSKFVHLIVYSKLLRSKRLYVMTHPKTLKKAPYGDKDVMNYSSRSWNDNVTNESKGNLSIIDLFNIAKKDVNEGINLLDTLLKEDLSIDEMKLKIDKFTKIINHDGDKVGMIKKYFDVLFLK